MNPKSRRELPGGAGKMATVRHIDPLAAPSSGHLSWAAKAFASWENWSAFGNNASPQAFVSNPQFHLIVEHESPFKLSLTLRNPKYPAVGKRFWIASAKDSDSDLRCFNWAESSRQTCRVLFESKFVACHGAFEETVFLPCGHYFVLISTSENPGGDGVELAAEGAALIAPCAEVYRSEDLSDFSVTQDVFDRAAASAAHASNPQFALTVPAGRYPLLIRMSCEITCAGDAIRFWVVRATGRDGPLMTWDEADVCLTSSFLCSGAITESSCLPQGNYVIVVSKIEPANAKVSVRALCCGAVAGIHALPRPRRAAVTHEFRAIVHTFGSICSAAVHLLNPQFHLTVAADTIPLNIRMKVSALADDDDAIRFWIVRTNRWDGQQHLLVWSESDIAFVSAFTRTSELSQMVTLRCGSYVVVPSKFSPADCQVTLEFVSAAAIVVKAVPQPKVQHCAIQLRRDMHSFGNSSSSTEFSRNPQVMFCVRASKNQRAAVSIRMSMSAASAVDDDAIRFWVIRSAPHSDASHQLHWIADDVKYESPFRRTSSLEAVFEAHVGLPYFIVPSKLTSESCAISFILACSDDFGISMVPNPIAFNSTVFFSPQRHAFGSSALSNSFNGNPQVALYISGDETRSHPLTIRMKVSALADDDDAIRFWIVRTNRWDGQQHLLVWSESDIAFVSAFTRTSELSQMVTLRCGSYVVVPSKFSPADCQVTLEFVSAAAIVVKAVPQPKVQHCAIRLHRDLHAFGNALESNAFGRNPQILLRVESSATPKMADVALTLMVPELNESSALRFWLIRTSPNCTEHLFRWDETSSVVFASPFLRDSSMSCTVVLEPGDYRVVTTVSVEQTCVAAYSVASNADVLSLAVVDPPQISVVAAAFPLDLSYFGSETDVQHFSNGPQWHFTLDRESDCEFVLRMKRKCDACGIRFFLAPAVGGAPRRRNGWTTADVIKSFPFLRSDTVTGNLRLRAGSYNILAASSNPPAQPVASLTMTCSSQTFLTVLPFVAPRHNFDPCDALVGPLRSTLLDKTEAAEVVDRICTQCQISGSVFRDSSFEGYAAIGTSRIVRRDGASFDLTWERFGDCCDDPCVVGDRGDMYQTEQGFLGNCWLVSTFAALGMNPSLIGNLIYPKRYNPCGVYAVKLFVEGAWKAVLLDDRIPVVANTHRAAFTLSVRRNEMWIPLLEKAFAKLAGCYEKLNGRLSRISRADALQFLTGGVAHQESLLDSAFVRKVQHAEKMGFPMTVGTNFDESSKFGIVGDHEYCLLGVRSLGALTLVCVYNPWGSGEWTGRWSRKCPQWLSNPHMAKLCRTCDSVPGVSWMEIHDFRKLFGPCFTVCVVSPSIIVKDLSRNFNLVLLLFPEQGVEDDISERRETGLTLKLHRCSTASVRRQSDPGMFIQLRDSVQETLCVPISAKEIVLEVSLAEIPRRGTHLKITSSCIVTVSRVEHHAGELTVPPQRSKCGCLAGSSGWHKPDCHFADSTPVDDDWN